MVVNSWCEGRQGVDLPLIEGGQTLLERVEIDYCGGFTVDPKDGFDPRRLRK